MSLGLQIARPNSGGRHAIEHGPVRGLAAFRLAPRSRLGLSRGLGVGTKVGAAVGGTIMSIAPATGPAAPFVLLAGALVELFSAFFGGGCGGACIAAAEREQIYEATADNILACAKAGLISGSGAAAAIQAMITAGEQAEAQLQTSQGKAGGVNLTKATAGQVSAASAYGAPTVPFTLSACQALYIPLSKSGWYQGSLAQAQQLSDQVLPQIATADAQSVSSVTSGVASELSTALGVSISPTVLLIVAGVGAYLMLAK